MSNDKVKLLMFFNKINTYRETENFKVKVKIYKSLYGDDMIDTVIGDKYYVISYLQYYLQLISQECPNTSFEIKVENKDKNIFKLSYNNV